MTLKDTRTKEEQNLCIRISDLMRGLLEKQDPRHKEIFNIMIDTITTTKGNGHYEDLLYRGCKAVFSHVESKYPDLYGIIQKSRKDLNKKP